MIKQNKKIHNSIVLLSILVISSFFVINIFVSCFPVSNAILVVTAIIVLWYTVETYLIRIANQELLYKSHRPIVGFNLVANSSNQFDARFRLVNHSEYPVAVRVKLNFKINDEIIPGIWPAYDGKEYWNLQYRQSVEGHFDILKIYAKSKLFTDLDIKDIQDITKQDKKRLITIEARNKNELESDPILTSVVEVFSENDKGEKIFYPPMKFQYDPYRELWVPTVTSKKPYWDYETTPPWA